MESVTMGKVLVKAKLESLSDLYEVKKGRLDAAQVRSVEVPDALVDTGATGLSLPRPVIERLGLDSYRKRRIRTSLGVGETTMYEAVRLTIQERVCTVDVNEGAEGSPVLIG